MHFRRTAQRAILTAALAVGLAAPAQAQSGDDRGKRTRVKVGAQLVPDYPGAEGTTIQPLVGLSFAKAGEDFDFSAADQSLGFSLLRTEGFSFGPVIGLVGKRSRSDTNGLLLTVKFSLEPGAFAQFGNDHFRVRGEVRQGVTGHKALIGIVGADFVTRDHDNWLFAIGPRYTVASGKYQRAYFGVPAGTPGLVAYRPDGGSNAVGAAASGNFALSERWGIAGYAKYDRLIGDARRSPVVRQLGDRNQLSGGLGLTYTF